VPTTQLVETTSEPCVRTLLAIDEVAEHFGVAVGTLYKLMARGEFPRPLRIGRRLVRWDADALNQWIVGGCPKIELRCTDQHSRLKSTPAKQR
jgi:prophage regulatory protein